MQAPTALAGMQGQGLRAGIHGAPRHVAASDSRMLGAGIVAMALAVAMLLAMIPGFARVPVDGPIVPAPLPAPAPLVVDVAIR